MNTNKLNSSARCEAPLTVAIGRKVGPAYRTGFTLANRLLAVLQREALSNLLPHLKPVSLERGRVLCDVDEPLRDVYFLERGIVSTMAVFGDGTTVEMATVGREGLIGVGSVLGGERALGRYVVPMPGLALAIEASQFRRALRESEELRATCGAYAQAFLCEALQTAACNSVHMVEERCARWLLMTYDRSDSDTLALTQGYLAEVLGVCRSTVTLAAGALQRAGMIRYRRGTIRVVDRPSLAKASCECYRVIRNQYERLLPRTYEGEPFTRTPSLVNEPHLSRAFG